MPVAADPVPAVADMPSPPHTSSFFCEKLKEARQLGYTPADEHEPYKHRYAAADLLKELADQLVSQQEQQEQQEKEQQQLVIAWCKLERGLQLLETDLLADGQKVLEEALAYAWPDTVEALAMQLQAHNALASLWCERSENETALSHLQSADTLYNHITQLQGSSAAGPAQQSTTQQQPADAASASSDATSSSSSNWQAGLVDSDQVERDRTTTLFYMAQVYGLMGDRMQSASYCAATLNRQLKQGDLDLNEWVQNCLQLSGCFLDCNTFALSQHCCAAVEALLLQQHQLQQQGQAQGQQEASDASCATQDKDTANQQQEQQQQQQQEQDKQSAGPNSSSANKDQTDGKDQAAKQQQQRGAASKGPSSQQQQQEQHSEEDAAVPGGPSPALVAALSLLESDVAANVCLAFAKLHLYTLVASHEVVLEGKQVEAAFSSAQQVPAVLCFDALPDLPPLSSLAWGPDVYAHTYDQALPLFKAALPWFRRALSHYQLDGWVTEHVNTLFEMSNLYRCLAGFESDPHKRCVMHRARTKLLAPLEGQLSPTHYPGLSRSISLELGNTFREIADIKAAAGREPEKVAAAMQSAAGHYRLFLDSFRVEGSGALPDRVEPEMEQHYLSGLFSMARMLQGLPGTGTLLPCGAGGGCGGDASAGGAAGQQDKARQQELELLEQARGVLGSLVKYVRTNEVPGWGEQADMADELAGLLREKMNLVRSVAQLQQGDGAVVC